MNQSFIFQRIGDDANNFFRYGQMPQIDLIGGSKNLLFGRKDVTKSENLGDLKEEYKKVNDQLFNAVQTYKSGDIRAAKTVQELSVKKQKISDRIKEVEKFVPEESGGTKKDSKEENTSLLSLARDVAKKSGSSETPTVQPKTPKVPNSASSSLASAASSLKGMSSASGPEICSE